ncbi:hypothetical protein J6590_094601 [Homalodisca vitripennis]|nr:hypothetical protein J6590_094601 [Homalodisca vitripennis]
MKMWFEFSFDTYPVIPPSTYYEWVHVVVAVDTITLEVEIHVYPFEDDSGPTDADEQTLQRRAHFPPKCVRYVEVLVTGRFVEKMVNEPEYIPKLETNAPMVHSKNKHFWN